MAKIQIFLDTDVVISSLLSKTGASYEVIKNPKVEKIISKSVEAETKEVSKRLNLDSKDTNQLLKKTKLTTFGLTKGSVLERYKDYVFDENDSHIIAGAHNAKVRFLLTHNLRHYRVDKINTQLGIIVLKPGNFLQYLRSVDKF